MIDLSDLDAAVASFKRSRRIAADAKAKAATKRPLPDAERVEPLSLFTNPENWTRTRGIALIHEDTNTLLGNFSEFVHRTEPGCRRLVREDGLLAVATTEFTSWLPAAEQPPERAEEWHTRQTVIVPLHLERLGVQTVIAEVVVHLSYGNMARAELAVDTQFFPTAGGAEQLLWLRAGVNVLPVMSQDSKINLRLEMNK